MPDAAVAGRGHGGRFSGRGGGGRGRGGTGRSIILQLGALKKYIM